MLVIIKTLDTVVDNTFIRARKACALFFLRDSRSIFRSPIVIILKKCRSISKQLGSGSTVAAQLLNLVSIVDCGREKKEEENLAAIQSSWSSSSGSCIVDNVCTKDAALHWITTSHHTGSTSCIMMSFKVVTKAHTLLTFTS